MRMLGLVLVVVLALACRRRAPGAEVAWWPPAQASWWSAPVEDHPASPGKWRHSKEDGADWGWYDGEEFRGRWVATTQLYYPWDGKKYGAPRKLLGPKQQLHSHKCPTCGSVWSHGHESFGDAAAHTCPFCGSQSWMPMPYQGP